LDADGNGAFLAMGGGAGGLSAGGRATAAIAVSSLEVATVNARNDVIQVSGDVAQVRQWRHLHDYDVIGMTS